MSTLAALKFICQNISQVIPYRYSACFFTSSHIYGKNKFTLEWWAILLNELSKNFSIKKRKHSKKNLELSG